jgi:hypothetical protein
VPPKKLLLNPALRGGTTPLAEMGGSSKSNKSTRRDPTRQLDASEWNQAVEAVVDVIADKWKDLDVKWFSTSTIDDGVADARPAIEAALSYAAANGRNVELTGAGPYRVSQAVRMASAAKVRVRSRSGATVRMPSSDTTLGNDASYGSDAAFKRGAFFCQDCSDITFEGVHVVGDDAQTDINVNTGIAFGFKNCTRPQLINCRQDYGAALVQQTNDANDFGALVMGCYSYGSRKNSRLGSGGSFIGCTFELPWTSSYDRSGNNGSSHAIYHYATSGGFLLVEACTFKNIQLDCVKMSGSAATCTGLQVVNCKFINCGKKSDGTGGGGTPVMFGADDNTEHSVVVISGCAAYDCAAFCQINGSRGVQIVGNQIYYSAAPVVAGTAVISIARYSASSTGVGIATEPVDGVQVHDNLIIAPANVGGELICTNAIAVTECGINGWRPDTVSIQGNQISHVGSCAIITTRCNAPVVANNVISGVISAIGTIGDRRPWIHHNRILNQQSNNAQIRVAMSTWPCIHDNWGAGYYAQQLSPKGGRPEIGIGTNFSNANAPTIPAFRGVCGFALPAEDKHEIVVAYGDNWTPAGTQNLGRVSSFTAATAGTITLVSSGGSKNAGKFWPGQQFFASPNSNGSSPRAGTVTVASVDRNANTVTFTGTITGLANNDYLFQAADTFELNGTILTYVSSAPGANQFNSYATFLTALSAVAGFTAADLGTSAGLTQNHHVRIRRTATGGSTFYVRSQCSRPTAGDILVNDTVSLDRTNSRGLNSSGTAGENKVVVWSPYIERSTIPRLEPYNAAARTALAGVVPMRDITSTGDEQACSVISIGSAVLAGTEIFCWSV